MKKSGASYINIPIYFNDNFDWLLLAYTVLSRKHVYYIIMHDLYCISDSLLLAKETSLLVAAIAREEPHCLLPHRLLPQRLLPQHGTQIVKS
jgi:hypothetical protein